MNLKRLVFGVGLGLVLAGQALHAQPSDADRQALTHPPRQGGKGRCSTQFELGMAFYLGKFGEATNNVEAAKCFRNAAEQNLAGAQYNLGCCYAKGQGVGRS